MRNTRGGVTAAGKRADGPIPPTSTAAVYDMAIPEGPTKPKSSPCAVGEAAEKRLAEKIMEAPPGTTANECRSVGVFSASLLGPRPLLAIIARGVPRDSKPLASFRTPLI